MSEYDIIMHRYIYHHISPIAISLECTTCSVACQKSKRLDVHFVFVILIQTI
ncbi:hypothetical protein PPL_11858 [Heterostelium album PN500]|uniref:Uncharacterized protein n=1 Tax=Heterostelium pallidum (strain ATCC 26659 / Pp 5 / PN500) TaxID=670386 RepID=D3BUN7_HETP5|nr:hypothetical protein PPL_11858 [Heterostelium album PN500]EFA74825.1 hypothetical protein PPL_11858 [Heterostelium album PN500]|eukprot:XP_020426959.1 hypothetical protein PPL_11858 [Heterostelium album PN500]